MKKGFTLIELLGVIIIITVISTIAVIAVDNSIKKVKIKTCEAQKENIIEAAKTWQTDNPITNTTQVYVNNSSQTNDLTKGGYIDKDLKNPMTDKKYDNNTYVEITVTNNFNKQEYNYQLIFGTNDIDCN